MLRTEHFDVYHYQGTERAVQDAAVMAERGYQRLSRVLQHQIKVRIPLILYASHTDFEQTNITPELIGIGTGGVTEFLKRRVFLPFTGSYAELDHVLTHELVHAFQVDILFGDRPGIVGNPFATVPPLWFMEGMAEYLSVGEIDTNTQSWLRDASLEGYLIPITTLAYVGDIRVYRFGQSIFKYIADTYGIQKVGDLLEADAAARERGSRARVLDRPDRGGALEEVAGVGPQAVPAADRRLREGRRHRGQAHRLRARPFELQRRGRSLPDGDADGLHLRQEHVQQRLSRLGARRQGLQEAGRGSAPPPSRRSASSIPRSPGRPTRRWSPSAKVGARTRST